MSRHRPFAVPYNKDESLLAETFHTYQASLELLAAAWTARGAKAFAIWDEYLLACWPESSRSLFEGAEPMDAIRQAPLKLEGQTIGHLGVIGLDSLQEQVRLDTDAAFISHVICLQTELERVTTERIAQARLKTELELTASIQVQLLPQKIPHIPGLDMYARSRPATQVGGDFYKFNAQRDPFVFAVGDVSGKGLPAALLMAMTRIVLHGAARFIPVLHPKAILTRAIENLYDDFTEVGMFSTVFVGCYEAENRQLAYANAGHSPVIYYPAGGRATMLEADGPAIGVLPNNLCENSLLTFSPGDVLVVATDGFSEAHNVHGELFGYERLIELVEELSAQPAVEIAETLFQKISHFAMGCDQYDDQTLIVIKGVEL
jgi:phosphoserine phosphatase RsbU/P